MSFLVCGIGFPEPQSQTEVHGFFMAEKEQIQEMHIGKMVAAELERQGRKVEWLARQLPCDKSNMYKLLKKPNWDVAMLIRISRILGHDFMHDLSAWVE